MNYTENLPKMKRFHHRESSEVQGRGSQNFKMGHFQDLTENQDGEGKPHPDVNKFQKGLGKEGFDKTELGGDFTSIKERKDDVEEVMDVFIQGLKLAADARKVLPTKNSLMSAQVNGQAQQCVNLFTPIEMLNILPVSEPEFLEVEMTLDTGATVHAMDILDLPGFVVEESIGSKMGQKFQAAGGKLIDNEGQVQITMLAPGTNQELVCNVQIAKVTRPLLSVTKMTESGKVKVLCLQDVAEVQDLKGNVLASFKKAGGLYTAMMRVRNPKFLPFGRPAR